jgi:hypothetical protein
MISFRGKAKDRILFFHLLFPACLHSTPAHSCCSLGSKTNGIKQ